MLLLPRGILPSLNAGVDRLRRRERLEPRGAAS
jgi:hypothetical protein